MSLRVNSKSITSNYTVDPVDVVLTIDAGSLTITLPAFDDVQIKDTKSFILIANNAYTLNSTGVNFAINGTTTYSASSGQNLIATYVQGLWYLNAYDIVTASGGGITQLTGDVTAGPGSGSQVATIANDAVTFAKMQNIATDSLIGRDTAGTGDPENITLNATLSMDGSGSLQRAALTGDVTASAGSNTTTIANNAVTLAKIQQVAAFKMLTNNTNATDELVEDDFQDQSEQAITVTPTYTGTTAPSGASTLSQWFLRVGDMVFYKFFLTYATASTATTAITIPFPSEFPTPLLPTGLTGASQFLYFMEYSRAITTPSGSVTSNAAAALKRNAGNTANEFVFSMTSGNYRTFHMGGNYRCS